VIIKFDSGTGRPSFFNPLPGAVVEVADNTLAKRRVEVKSANPASATAATATS
jgi:peptide methionine sulfoxide reductase msrA/msrB